MAEKEEQKVDTQPAEEEILPSTAKDGTNESVTLFLGILYKLKISLRVYILKLSSIFEGT